MTVASSKKSPNSTLKGNLLLPAVSIRTTKSLRRNVEQAGSSECLRRPSAFSCTGNFPLMAVTRLVGELGLDKTTVYRLLIAMPQFELARWTLTELSRRGERESRLVRNFTVVLLRL